MRERNAPVRRVDRMDKELILFDLDGTLTDPKTGITKCVQYALASFGIEEQNLDRLECYIGPPLDESFERFHGLSEADALLAVEQYRTRFKDTGIFENEVIPGIPEALKRLKAAGKTLALATCKPEVFALRILEHFGLSAYFTVAVGSELDGTRKHKNEVIEEVFARLLKLQKTVNGEYGTAGLKTPEQLSWMKASAVMVGDRRQDITGAQMAGIESVGVRFGYAEEGELEEAGADEIAETVEQMTALLLGEI